MHRYETNAATPRRKTPAGVTSEALDFDAVSVAVELSYIERLGLVAYRHTRVP